MCVCVCFGAFSDEEDTNVLIKCVFSLGLMVISYLTQQRCVRKPRAAFAPAPPCALIFAVQVMCHQDIVPFGALCASAKMAKPAQMKQDEAKRYLQQEP